MLVNFDCCKPGEPRAGTCSDRPRELIARKLQVSGSDGRFRHMGSLARQSDSPATRIMKMLVVDDHAILRQGLAALLIDSGAASEVLHAANLAEGLTLAGARRDLDVVLLDLTLPDARGVSAIAAFSDLDPTLPILIVSASEEPADVRRTLDAGALGYVPKSASPETLLAAVRLVLEGGICVPPLMLHASPAPPAAPDGLTPRQGEVLQALANGLSNKAIGRMFGLSEKTVKAHVGAIFRVLGVSSRTQAIRAAHDAAKAPITRL
jgi:DNA-binding NarL/FixJ family response regulator